MVAFIWCHMINEASSFKKKKSKKKNLNTKGKIGISMQESENMENQVVKYTQTCRPKKKNKKKKQICTQNITHKMGVKTSKNTHKAQASRRSSSDTVAQTLHLPILLRILACGGKVVSV